MTRSVLALLCLSLVWPWPATARGEDDRETMQLRVEVELLRTQLRLLELDAHARTLGAIEDALIMRATADLAVLRLSELPRAYEPRGSRWGRATWLGFALGVVIGTAAGAVIGATMVLAQ